LPQLPQLAGSDVSSTQTPLHTVPVLQLDPSMPTDESDTTPESLAKPSNPLSTRVPSDSGPSDSGPSAAGPSASASAPPSPK
jgi:hypothetical protein